MKKLLLVFSALFCLTALSLIPETAEAYWGYRNYRGSRSHRGGRYVPRAPRVYHFRPRFSVSFSGGLHFVDAFEDGATALTHGMAELGTHLWLHPNLSIDLNLGTHFLIDDVNGVEWGYMSVKPGFRAKFGIFYLRGALDLAITGRAHEKHKRAVLFGFLLGAGLRIPVGRKVRIFGEIDYQILFADIYYMPVYGQAGIEVVF